LADDNANRLADRIAYFGANLRGARPYWTSKRNDLVAIIKDIKLPHFFATASAADVQWKDLHCLMPQEAPINAIEQERIRICNQNLNNPAIAAWYFYKRWMIFFEHVLRPKFDIQDWWFRFEWQFRGSSHVHAFFWLRNAPSVEDLDLNDPETVTKFIDFWDPLVSAWNPAPDEPPAVVHPSARSPLAMNYNLRELAQLINRVQRHTKCTSYCLHRPKGAPKHAALQCRFKFPQLLEEFSARTKTINILDFILDEMTSS
jgi:ATP-dependent DNA helicase PIF1